MIAIGAYVALAAPRGVDFGVPAPAGLEQAYSSRRVALVVGIDTYEDPALGDLAYAAKDATDLAAVLRDPELGDYDQVSVLSGQVDKAAFWAEFRALASQIQRDDTVMVYVAGHGTLDLEAGGTELYLLSSDAWLSDAARTGIRVDDLADAVSHLPARRTVIVLDACYSGTGRSVLEPSVAGKLARLRGPVPSPRALVVSEFQANLYAAHVHQPSMEDPSLQNGVYTHYFVEALRGSGDMDGDGLVEVMEAHGYARDHTLAFSHGTQVPWAETVSVGREVLYLSGDPSRRTESEDAWLTGIEALPIDARITVDGTPRGAGPLTEGRHQVEVRSGDTVVLDRVLSVAPGDRVDLGAQIARDAARWSFAVGAAGSGGDAVVLGRTRAIVSAARSSRARGAGRFEARAEATAGAVGFAVGTVTGGGGFLFRLGPLELGPTLGLGLAWRMPREPGPQASPLFTPGATARVGQATFLELRLEAPALQANHALVVLPTAGVLLGFTGRTVTVPFPHR